MITWTLARALLRAVYKDRAALVAENLALTWRAFLDNHARELVAIDFFVVPTIGFKLLWGFVVLSHDRRRIVHVNATANPSARWAAQQIREAFPWNEAPRFLRSGGGTSARRHRRGADGGWSSPSLHEARGIVRSGYSLLACAWRRPGSCARSGFLRVDVRGCGPVDW